MPRGWAFLERVQTPALLRRHPAGAEQPPPLVFTVRGVYNGAPCLTSRSPSGQRLRAGLRTRSPLRVPTITGPKCVLLPHSCPAPFLVLRPPPHCLIPESPLHELPPIQCFQAPGGRGLGVECAPLIL